MEKSALYSAELTHNLFWYGVLSGVVGTILAFIPTAFSEVLGFIFSAINFILILVGSVLAYAYRKKSEPPLTSHYQYLIGTLWLMVFFSLIGFVLSLNSTLSDINHALSADLGGQQLLPNNSLLPNSTGLNNSVNLLMQLYLFARVYKARRLLKIRMPIPKPKTWFI